MNWKQLTERDRREWKLSAIDPRDRDTWRSGVRSAMRAASQLPWKGAHCCGYGPYTCTLIKKSDDDDDDDDDDERYSNGRDMLEVPVFNGASAALYVEIVRQ